MKLTIYQIDAFAEKPFEGNPAAVVPLGAWLPYQTMQRIAEENNLAETAFFVPVAKGFHIRWFTPAKEVSLCGHATLAAAFVLFDLLAYSQNAVVFESLSGDLLVEKNGKLLSLNFPSQPPVDCETPSKLADGLGATPLACLKHEDYVAVFENEAEVLNISPNYHLLSQLDLRGVIVTAPSSNYDFVVRFFAPKYGIDEDPVTGSAYTKLIPYWAKKLGKTTLEARQISARGGNIHGQLLGDRVLISGSVIKYMEGTIEI